MISWDIFLLIYVSCMYVDSTIFTELKHCDTSDSLSHAYINQPRYHLHVHLSQLELGYRSII